MRLSRRSLLFAALARAQDANFSTSVKVVTLIATVRDRDGKIVNNLTQQDFELQEDGRPQTVRYFSRESDLPLTVGLLVDTSMSEAHDLERERQASYTFLDQMLREDRDAAFIASFDRSVHLLQGLTSSREKLRAALAELRVKSYTALFDAVKQCSEELMRKQAGRKAFILLSDGGDNHSHVSIQTAIEYAQRADTIIYCIYHGSFRINSPAGMAVEAAFRARGKRILRRLSTETGGGYFEVSKNEPLEKIYTQIEDELRNEYSIGYISDSTDKSGAYRKIKLAARNKLEVRTRDGYYPN